MNPSPCTAIQNIIATDSTPSVVELHPTHPGTVHPSDGNGCREHPLTLTQKGAAMLLGVNRTTIWRFTKMGILRPQELAPGTFRYSREQLETLARHGYRAMKKQATSRRAA